MRFGPDQICLPLIMMTIIDDIMHRGLTPSISEQIVRLADELFFSFSHSTETCIDFEAIYFENPQSSLSQPSSFASAAQNICLFVCLSACLLIHQKTQSEKIRIAYLTWQAIR